MKILVATDGSRGSAAAVRFAGDLASASRGRLTVVTVGETAPDVIAGAVVSRDLPPLERLERRAARAALEKARRETRRLSVPARLEYLASARAQPFATAIARSAMRRGADLIVVGNSGGRAFSRWILGSVSNRLVHAANRPVAVVRKWAPKANRELFRIVVATDGSRSASPAVRFAARLASTIPKARLVILTVSTLSADLALTPPGFVRALDLRPALDRADRRAAEKILRDAARQARLGRRATVRYYKPARRLFAADAILEEARREGADLIVLGRTGRSSFGDIVLGSVARRVLALAGRPVALVPRRPPKPKIRR